MKKYGQIVMAVVAILLFLPDTSAQTTNEFTVPLSDPGKRGKLKAHLNSGTIIVKGTARKDVLIKYSISAEGDHDHKSKGKHNDNSSKEGLKRIGGGGVDLEVTENANYVKAESGSWNMPMKLEIEVPVGFDLQLHTYNNGDLMVSNIQGALELTNYNGEITALNISGSVVANTYNGEIRVTFDKVTDGTPMSYSTYNGDIDISFPPSVKGTLKLKTEQGSIYSDFDLQLKSSGPVQKSDNQGGVYKVIVDEWKRGDLNGGGAELSMRNYNGDIILRKK